MEIDAELRRRIVVSCLAGAGFVAGLVVIGTTFGDSNQLPEEGALALVGLLIGFVLVMAIVGVFLMRTDVNDDEEAGDGDPEETAAA